MPAALRACRVTALILALLGAREAGGQGIRGTVVRQDQQTPARGIVVLVVDEQQRLAGRALTTSTGAFEVRLAAAGTYTVRALQIGYRPTDAGPFQVTGDSVHVVRVVLAGEALVLETVAIDARQSCRNVGDGASVAAAWTQARAALAAAAITAESDGFLTRYATWQRVANDKDSVVTFQQSRIAEVRQPRIFASAPPDSLATVGYVFEDGGQMVFLGPDADVLLSDRFASMHCFRLAASPDGDSSRVAIEFEPSARKGRMIDVKGRLVLDRKTSELRFLEFSYDGLPRNITPQMAGGRLDFRRVPDGAWIVNYWTLRIPSVILEGTEGFMDRARMRVQEVRETGGEILRMTREDEELWRGRERQIVGRLVDDAGVPAVKGRVQLEGTNVGKVTEDDGTFVLDEVLPGRYAMMGASAALDSLGVPTRVGIVDVREANALDQSFKLPSVDEVYRTACRREGEGSKNATGLLRGFVVDGAGVGVAGAQVRVQFVDKDSVTEWITNQRRKHIMIEAAPDGSFNYCRVPRGSRLRLTPIVNEVDGKSVDAELPADRAYVVVQLRAP